jgi:hypothetical protein
VDVVVVVAALVGFPDALDAQPVVLEGEQAASSGCVCAWAGGAPAATRHAVMI